MFTPLLYSLHTLTVYLFNIEIVSEAGISYHTTLTLKLIYNVLEWDGVNLQWTQLKSVDVFNSPSVSNQCYEELMYNLLMGLYKLAAVSKSHNSNLQCKLIIYFYHRRIFEFKKKKNWMRNNKSLNFRYIFIFFIYYFLFKRKKKTYRSSSLYKKRMKRA